MNLYPSILTESSREAQEQILWIASFPKIRTVQVDVIDGHFADNTTITPADFWDLDFGELSCDAHLMTEEPLDFVYECIEYREHAPIRSVIGQIERMGSQEHFIEAVTKQQWQVGLSLDLFTPIESIDDDSWHRLDCVQLMSIEAGFQGQAFDERVFDKLKDLRKVLDEKGLSPEVIVDGGISPKLVDMLEEHRVGGMVVGSGLWNTQDIDQAVEQYLE